MTDQDTANAGGATDSEAGNSAAMADIRHPSDHVPCRRAVRGAGLFAGLYDRMAEDATRILQVGDVLEVGGGSGLLAVRMLRLASGLRLRGIDIDPEMVGLSADRVEREGLTGRATFETGDVAALPMPSQSFDLVVTSMSVHHWDDPARGFAEIHRVLRPGARAIVWELPRPLIWLEGHRGELETTVAASPFGGGIPSHLRWPGRVPFLRRVELRRLP